jgi:hypothetical protein
MTARKIIEKSESEQIVPNFIQIGIIRSEIDDHMIFDVGAAIFPSRLTALDVLVELPLFNQ